MSDRLDQQPRPRSSCLPVEMCHIPCQEKRLVNNCLHQVCTGRQQVEQVHMASRRYFDRVLTSQAKIDLVMMARPEALGEIAYLGRMGHMGPTQVEHFGS